MNRVSDQRGQAIVLTVLMMTALIGMASLVLDVGSWFRVQRNAQSIADAAALAGAQALPEDAAQAAALARSYAAQNGGELATVSFSNKWNSSDTISVTVDTPTPGIFSRLFNIDSVTVHSRAAAVATAPGQALHVAPISIGSDNPQLVCGAPCYGQTTQMIALPTGNNNGNQTNFQLIDLSQHGGNVAPSLASTWLRNGYDDYVSLKQYPGLSSTTFNSSEFRQAMLDMKGKTLLVLVHSNANGGEGQAGTPYSEVGWAAFTITDFSGSGAQGLLTGYFTSANVDGLPGGKLSAAHGVRTISLVE